MKNFRPQYLFLTGNLEERPDMLIAMKLMKKSRGVMIAGNVLLGNIYDNYVAHAEAEAHGNVMVNGIEGFASLVVAPTLLEGVTSLQQISGLGRLKANTVILGYKYNWMQETNEKVISVSLYLCARIFSNGLFFVFSWKSTVRLFAFLS